MIISICFVINMEKTDYHYKRKIFNAHAILSVFGTFTFLNVHPIVSDTLQPIPIQIHLLLLLF